MDDLHRPGDKTPMAIEQVEKINDGTAVTIDNCKIKSYVSCVCHSALDAESSILYVSGFPLEFIPYLIRDGNDEM